MTTAVFPRTSAGISLL